MVSKKAILLSAFGVSLLAGCGAVFVNQGSKNASLADGLQNPDANKPKVVVSKDAGLITNFDDGSPNMSANLYGHPDGSWIVFSFGGNTTNKEFIVSGGADNTKMAAHVFGTLVDKGDAQYPAFTLQGKFRQSGLYDASPFTGIKFYYKCPSTDQALKRRFAIGTAPTLPASDGGTCPGNCYNHFGYDLKASSDWTPYTLKFTDLTRESGWGAPVTPPDLVDHLKEFIYIKWDHSANNAAGSYNIDYWVDQVEFF